MIINKLYLFGWSSRNGYALYTNKLQNKTVNSFEEKEEM